jgi:hypothetical protein
MHTHKMVVVVAQVVATAVQVIIVQLPAQVEHMAEAVDQVDGTLLVALVEVVQSGLSGVQVEPSRQLLLLTNKLNTN